MMQALAGYDAADPASSREPVGDYSSALRAGVAGLRVGIPRDYFFQGVTPEVGDAFESAMATLSGLGATVREVQIPSIWAAPAFTVIMLSEAFA